MSNMYIRGSEYPIKKIFSDDFVFTIPLYQRAYAWATEESEELLQDLLMAIGDYKKPIEDLPPYFLGSIMLIKDDEPDAQVIDGQQRLTTLTMLLAVLRSLIKTEYVDGLTSFLCEKGNIITGTPTRYRLRLRERDAKFFQKYIQDEGGTEKLKELQETLLPDSQRNIRDNTLGFIRELQKLSENQLITLTQFIVNRCFLIVVTVSTPDLDSVYRIFSVLNSRGLGLSYPDILKAEILGTIPPDRQDEYATRWEELESMLGSELFEDLFFKLRAIFSQKRQSKGMIEEFHEYVYPRRPQTSSAQDFIDKTLDDYARGLNYIVNANYPGSPTCPAAQVKEINGMFKWLNQLDYGRWTSPALYYLIQNWRQPHLIPHFLKDLERLVIGFIICKAPPYQRIDRYCEILKAIHEGHDLYAPNSPLQLTPRESRDVLRRLEGEIYLTHPPSICRYILLRLDAKLSDGTASYDYQKVTVEHVLPQNPAPGSTWIKWFPVREVRERYVHRLGNLVLLSRGKNLKAANFDFDDKKQKYFKTSDGVSPFPLTTQVLNHQEWTPTVVERRQNQLIGTLKQLWRLS